MSTSANSKPINKIIITIGCLIILFIPIYIAVAYYNTAKNAPPSASNVTALVITDPAETEFSLMADDAESKKEIAWFLDVNDRAEKLTSVPDQLKNGAESGSGLFVFDFEYMIYDRTREYTYYFTANPEQAYFIDSNGDAYHIAGDDARDFLATKYARSLYPKTTKFPVLTVANSSVIPVEADWQYQIYGSDTMKSLEDVPTGVKPEEIFKMNGAFAISFDNEPDNLVVTIEHEGKQVHSGALKDVTNVKADIEGKVIDVKLEAKWYKTSDTPCEGSAVYKFKAKILLPAAFYLGDTAIDPGEFVVISAKNIEDPEAISFTSDPDIGYTPRFFMDGEYARALVPVSYNAIDTKNGAKTVKFTCTYGEVSQEMTLDINQYTFKNFTQDVGTAIVNATRTQRTLNAFDVAMQPVIEDTSSTPLWSDEYAMPLDGGQVRIGYGRHVTIANTTTTYRHTGVDLIPSGSKSAKAVTDGVVVYTGYLDYTGYLVVVDHGLGLKSWYAHLASYSVKAGDKVKAGDTLGVIGMYGFTETTKLHFGMSVFDVPVSPYPFIYEDDATGEIPGIKMSR